MICQVTLPIALLTLLKLWRKFNPMNLNWIESYK